MLVRPERPMWNPLPAVAQAIAAGEPWLLAWALQSATSYRMLSRKSGIADLRLDQIYLGATVSRGELTALAKAWNADLDEVLLTLPRGALIE
jgi:hypothetical protein